MSLDNIFGFSFLYNNGQMTNSLLNRKKPGPHRHLVIVIKNPHNVIELPLEYKQ